MLRSTSILAAESPMSVTFCVDVKANGMASQWREYNETFCLMRWLACSLKLIIIHAVSFV